MHSRHNDADFVRGGYLSDWESACSHAESSGPRDIHDLNSYREIVSLSSLSNQAIDSSFFSGRYIYEVLVIEIEFP